MMSSIRLIKSTIFTLGRDGNTGYDLRWKAFCLAFTEMVGRDIDRTSGGEVADDV
jgi:hypothetical protein